MKKNEQQLTYETPDLETIKIRMENSFMGGSNICGGDNENNEECTDDNCDFYH